MCDTGQYAPRRRLSTCIGHTRTTFRSFPMHKASTPEAACQQFTAQLHSMPRLRECLVCAACPGGWETTTGFDYCWKCDPGRYRSGLSCIGAAPLPYFQLPFYSQDMPTSFLCCDCSADAFRAHLTDCPPGRYQDGSNAFACPGLLSVAVCVVGTLLLG